jgi:hypothetical protein
VAEGLTYRLKIDAFTPATMPMGRLAEYMADLAIILGERSAVHFVELESNCTVLVHKVEAEAVPKVRARIDLVRRGEGPADAMNSSRSLNRRLREDAGMATLLEEKAEVLPFPGAGTPAVVTFPPFNQNGTLDGTVIRVGGRGAIVPVHIDAGTTIYSQCEATREVAKRLASHLFTAEVRVTGQGRWHVDESGTWVLNKFTIRDFEVLNGAPLTDVVAALRAASGSDWDAVADPWADLNAVRHEAEEPD